MLVILIFLFVFTLIPVAAPVLMHQGIEDPAKVIYWVYSHLCHQFAYRSWFLFGEQTFYPLEEAGMDGRLSYEAVFHEGNLDIEVSRSVIGNSHLGYKMAICQRDLAMYASLFIFGVIFLIEGRSIKRIPLWSWLLMGVFPLGLDGIFQLLSGFSEFIKIGWVWESTPLLRTATGGFFGFFTGWYLFPSIEMVIQGFRNDTLSTNSLMEK